MVSTFAGITFTSYIRFEYVNDFCAEIDKQRTSHAGSPLFTLGVWF